MRNPMPLLADMGRAVVRLPRVLRDSPLDRRRLAADALRIQLRRALVRAGRTYTTETVLGHRVAVPDYESFVFLFDEIFLQREYDVSLPEQPVVVDCGANIGLATMWFKIVRPDARITAIEADPIVCEQLRSTVRMNGWDDSVLVRHAAVGAHGDTASFYRSSTHIGHPQSGMTPLDHLDEAIAVPAAPLSTLIVDRPVDVLKLDVEGAEFGALQELVETDVLSVVNTVLIDVGQSDVAQLTATLEGAGFTCERSTVLTATRLRSTDQA